jgi:hypothetical protein
MGGMIKLKINQDKDLIILASKLIWYAHTFSVAGRI